MNLSACPTLLRTIEGGTWHRAVQPQHLSDALDLGYTRDVPSRFNAGGNDGQMQILISGRESVGHTVQGRGAVREPIDAYAKSRAAVDNCSHHRPSPRGRGSLSRRDPRTPRYDSPGIDGDWKGYAIRTPMHSVSEPAGLAPTQELGAALYAVPGLEGFITVSAKLPDSRNLVIFPQKLHSGSRLEYYDPQTRQTHVLP